MKDENLAAFMIRSVSKAVDGAASGIHLILMAVLMKPLKSPGALTDIKLELESLAEELGRMADEEARDG